MSDIEATVAQGSDELLGRVASFKQGLRIGTNDLDHIHQCKSVFIRG
jgi:hypothetical protein